MSLFARIRPYAAAGAPWFAAAAAIACVGIVGTAWLGGPAAQLGLVSVFDGFTAFRQVVGHSPWVVGAGLFALVVALLAKAPRSIAVSLLVVVLAIGSSLAAQSFRGGFRAVPTEADASTDLADPPVFAALLAERETDARNPAGYRGGEAPDLQRQHFPDLAPLAVAADPATAVAAADKVLRRMGLRVAAVDPAAGIVEAVDTTAWFGFKDDVVVRVRPGANGGGDGGSLVDVRSASRVGRLDAGVNGRRVAAILAALRKELGA